jgi:hypothetical protein
MNCSYRILESVHIGLRVRKTKDKKTIPYNNQPISDVYIKQWNDQGFRLQHEAFPTKDNTIWLDFGQLPLNGLNIEMGYIKNPIVFVEAIASYGGATSMVLLRADTFDYLELLDDKKFKEEKVLISPRALVPGDRVISAICKQSLEMVFLGIFNVAQISYEYNYGYRYGNNHQKAYYINNTPERAFFAYPQANGSYSIQSYPISNKVVKEVYRVKNNPIDGLFLNEKDNMDFLQARATVNSYYITAMTELPEPERFKPHLIKTETYSSDIYYQKGSKDIRENAVMWAFEKYNINNGKLFKTRQEAYNYL